MYLVISDPLWQTVMSYRFNALQLIKDINSKKKKKKWIEQPELISIISLAMLVWTEIARAKRRHWSSCINAACIFYLKWWDRHWLDDADNKSDNLNNQEVKRRDAVVLDWGSVYLGQFKNHLKISKQRSENRETTQHYTTQR